jgi:hypothetical protein
LALKTPSPDWFLPIVASAVVATFVAVTGCASTDPNSVPVTVSNRPSQGYRPASGPELNSTPPLAKAQTPNVPKSLPTTAANQYNCDKPEKCLDRLRVMVENPDRAWIKQPEQPAALANGIRLFAYSALHKKLGCDELASASLEVENAKKTFRGAVPGVSPEQLVAVRALSARVAKELLAETAARCNRLAPVG